MGRRDLGSLREVLPPGSSSADRRPWQSGVPVFNVSLSDEKTLVGTATLTTSVAGYQERERPIKLEKK